MGKRKSEDERTLTQCRTLSQCEQNIHLSVQGSFHEAYTHHNLFWSSVLGKGVFRLFKCNYEGSHIYIWKELDHNNNLQCHSIIYYSTSCMVINPNAHVAIHFSDDNPDNHKPTPSIFSSIIGIQFSSAIFFSDPQTTYQLWSPISFWFDNHCFVVQQLIILFNNWHSVC